MGIDPISMGLGLVGMIANQDSNRRAQNNVDENQEAQDRILDRQTGLFDLIQGIVQQADKDGQFDPDRMLAQLDKDVAQSKGRDMGALGAGLSAAGYKPGDSEVGTRMDDIALKYQDYRDRQATDIRQNSFLQKLNAYQGIGGQQLNPALSVYGQRAGDAQQNVQNPMGFFQSIMPFLQGGNRPQQSGTGFQMPQQDVFKFGSNPPQYS